MIDKWENEQLVDLKESMRGPGPFCLLEKIKNDSHSDSRLRWRHF